MGQTLTASRGRTPSSVVAASGPSLRKALADLWRALSKDLISSYHPERHYMRGPGPKWHAKHATASTLTAADYGFNGLTTA